MDNYEICSRLVDKTGVSFSQAKDALERSDWDMLDAVVLLEQEGTIPSAGGRYSSSAAAGESAETDRRRRDYDPDRTSGGARYRENDYGPGFEDEKARRAEKAQRKAENKRKCRDFMNRCGDFLKYNRLLAYNNTGKVVLDLPMWGAIVIIACTFWLSVILILISFINGWQYRFEGPDLGKESVNRAASTVGDTVYKMGHDIRDSFEGRTAGNGPVDVEYEEHPADSDVRR